MKFIQAFNSVNKPVLLVLRLLFQTSQLVIFPVIGKKHLEFLLKIVRVAFPTYLENGKVIKVAVISGLLSILKAQTEKSFL